MFNGIDEIKKPVVVEYNRFRNDFLTSLSSSTLRLQSAIGKIMQSTGKHIRPLLLLLSARACGEVNGNTINAAVLMELLHTATLVHDDVIDETKERRGEPALNVFFDNRVSVLVGDYLLSAALIRAIQTRDIRIITIVAEVGRALAEGEIMQIEMADEVVLDEQSYMELIYKKTAKFLSACAEIGALSVNASRKEVECFRLFGEYVGYCFQIKDDIFDYYPDIHIGKPTGSDLVEGKVTLPLLYALQHSVNGDVSHFKRIVKEREFTPQNISQLIDFTKRTGGMDYAEAEMKKYHDKALEVLFQLPESETRASLFLLADYVIGREK
ncbi:MAG: polyprenyl synthetase [Bacteroidales bacterium]